MLKPISNKPIKDVRSYCITCGRRIKQKLNFCPKCGSKN